MKYVPMCGEQEAKTRIGDLAFKEYAIVSYEEAWQREQGEPEIEITANLEYAVERFLELCGLILCAELRGVDLDGSEYPVCIGGLADDLSEEGEYIEE